MQIYLVGGAVRDALLGLPVTDRDWVVVGSTPEELVEQGFVPVGRDFPVFLHPQTREEYALARTERKSGHGYRGFVVHAEPDVTLEQDLARRDLTINSIAACALNSPASGQIHVDLAALTDPFGGQRDLQRKLLRHVTDAFREDPVRILRVARFAARFADFSVAPETLTLMRQMVEDGEADALVAERVWQELARGLMEQAPSRMLEVLSDCGALIALLSELDLGADDAGLTPRALDAAACSNAPLPVRFACLCLGARSPHALQQLCARWRVPNECRELAELVTREQRVIDGAATLDASGAVRLLERCDAFRKPARFQQALLACAYAASARAQPVAQTATPPETPRAYQPATRLHEALAAAHAVPTDAIAESAHRPGYPRCEGAGRLPPLLIGMTQPAGQRHFCCSL
jgi:tRNA nucleotidyltransferase (CCA-adding enzyme)